MNTDLRHNLHRTLQQNVRYDERKPDAYRDISVERGVASNAEGSARVKIGKTDVIAGVKLAVEKPYPDTPDEGGLMVGVELLPLSSPEFETGPPGIWAIELARVVDRGIRESKAIDHKRLCIEPGEKAWFLIIDICTINADGNLLDACALAAMAAIQDARMPPYDEEAGVVQYGELSDEKIPLNKEPVSVTVYKIGEHLLIDPTDEEENEVEARLTVASLDDSTLCAIQKGGNEPLSAEDIDRMITLALEKAKEIRPHLAASGRI